MANPRPVFRRPLRSLRDLQDEPVKSVKQVQISKTSDTPTESTRESPESETSEWVTPPEPPPSEIELEIARKEKELLLHAIDHLEERSPLDPEDSPISRLIYSKPDKITEHFKKQQEQIRLERAAELGLREIPATATTPSEPLPPRTHASSPEKQPAAAPQPTSAQPQSEAQRKAREEADFFSPGSPASFCEALMRYGSSSSDDYCVDYDPDNPEYADMSPRRRRLHIKKLMIDNGLVSPNLPGMIRPQSTDPDHRHDDEGTKPSRKGIGNPEGQKVSSSHPDGYNMSEAYCQLFNMNEGISGHNKLTDTDIAFILSEMFQSQRPRTATDVRELRSLYNSGKLKSSRVKPEDKSKRYIRLPADAKHPEKGYDVYLANNKSRPTFCVSDSRHPLNFPNKTPSKDGYRPRSEYPFPSAAPFWFKWWEDRIVTPEMFEALSYAKEKTEWEATHPGESFDLQPDLDLPEAEESEE